MPRQQNILVVDDDAGIRRLLISLLEPAGYQVHTAADGEEGLRALFSWQPDLLVLDVIMPKMSGWELLTRVREMSGMPVLMLTALGEEESRIKGLDSGADDYISKPFGAGEFLARVRVLLRRMGEAVPWKGTYKDSALFMDFLRHEVYVRDRHVKLSPLEFRTLQLLVENPGTLVSSNRILEVCWSGVGNPKNVTVCISQLRKKIEEYPRQPRLIETVWAFGYRYRPPEVPA